MGVKTNGGNGPLDPLPQSALLLYFVPLSLPLSPLVVAASIPTDFGDCRRSPVLRYTPEPPTLICSICISYLEVCFRISYARVLSAAAGDGDDDGVDCRRPSAPTQVSISFLPVLL